MTSAKRARNPKGSTCVANNRQTTTALPTAREIPKTCTKIGHDDRTKRVQDQMGNARAADIGQTTAVLDPQVSAGEYTMEWARRARNLTRNARAADG